VAGVVLEMVWEGGGGDEELDLWNNFLIYTLLILSAEAGDGVDPEADDLPLIRLESTGTLPKNLTLSDLIGSTEAGEEEIGAEASFMEPKVTEGPL
jgi:hypothetical protein